MDKCTLSGLMQAPGTCATFLFVRRYRIRFVLPLRPTSLARYLATYEFALFRGYANSTSTWSVGVCCCCARLLLACHTSTPVQHLPAANTNHESSSTQPQLVYLSSQWVCYRPALIRLLDDASLMPASRQAGSADRTFPICPFGLSVSLSLRPHISQSSAPFPPHLEPPSCMLDAYYHPTRPPIPHARSQHGWMATTVAVPPDTPS